MLFAGMFPCISRRKTSAKTQRPKKTSRKSSSSDATPRKRKIIISSLVNLLKRKNKAKVDKQYLFLDLLNNNILLFSMYRLVLKHHQLVAVVQRLILVSVLIPMGAEVAITIPLLVPFQCHPLAVRVAPLSLLVVDLEISKSFNIPSFMSPRLMPSRPLILR